MVVTLEEICKRSYYRERHIHTPLLTERLQYLQYWADRNTPLHSLQSIAQYLLRIVEYLHLENGGIISLAQIEKSATDWANYQYNHPQKKAAFSKTGKRRFIWYSIDWLKKLNRLEMLPQERVPLFNKIFERSKALHRQIESPLLDKRLMYLQLLADAGAKDSSLRHVAQYLLVIMDYLRFFELRIVSKKEIVTAAETWAGITPIARKKKNDFSEFSKARFIRDASRWLEMLGCLKKEIEPPVPFKEQLDKYIDYMRQEQGLSEMTISGRSSVLKDFLEKINVKKKTLASTSPVIIDEVLVVKSTIDGYSRRSVQTYASSVRSFLRYAENQAWCPMGLADSIKAPRVYVDESLPSSPFWDDIKKILVSSKTDRPTDIRDHAILMLLSVYGLRCSEVIHLQLKDLDWENEILYLKRIKRSKPQVFPLTQTVGEAILRYIKEVRPNNCRLNQVFICRRSPYRPLSTSAVYRIVSIRLKPLELKLKHHGPHALRHGCATHLINEGISLKEISDHLGHQAVETTRIYTRVDLTNLRKVAEFKLESLL